MSEQIHDQVSAFVDDELSAEECAFLVRRLERDPEARNKVARYSVIGAALRGELLQPDPAALQNRVNESLSGATMQPKAPAVAAAQSAPRSARWASPAFGLGIASTVAVGALFMIRAVNDGSDGTAQALSAGATSAPSSYVVPVEPEDNRVVAPPPIRLTNYLMHHGEYASRLSRTSVHSNVVGASDASAQIETVAAPDGAAPAEAEREAQ